MKHLAFISLTLLIFSYSCSTPFNSDFDRYFSDGSIRIDYFHSGDAKLESVSIDEVYKYDAWAGSRKNLLDTLDYGAYYYKVYDGTKGELIYSRGFDSYFKEYQLTKPAIQGEQKQFHESAILPFPRSKVIFSLEKRDRAGVLQEVFRTEIDPAEAIPGIEDPEVELYESLYSGEPGIKADIAIIGEGYTAEESQKFQDDLKRFTRVFFEAEPCKSHKDLFNIYGVLKPSHDSGVDEPRAGIDKNTAVNASFNSLGSARYLLTEDNKSLRDIAGHVAYDALYIMVNSSRYGGGGIYNFYCVYTSDNIFSDYLMVHEFGHSFFGLADEYYSSSTAYTDFYTPDQEPNEANITALMDPENVKWKHLLSEGVAVPTPWGKREYDSLEVAWQKEREKMNAEITSLKKEGASLEKITAAVDHFNRRSEERKSEVENFLEQNELTGKVGAFEGAGYSYSGLYRPSLNCIMFSRADYFCPVCQDAMIRVLKFYSE